MLFQAVSFVSVDTDSSAQMLLAITIKQDVATTVSSM
ncbi:hypothetical protein CDAR_91231, partial [Caerostris darwini]